MEREGEGGRLDRGGGEIEGETRDGVAEWDGLYND